MAMVIKCQQMNPAVMLASGQLHLDFAVKGLGANIPADGKILDFGCGSGLSVKALLDAGHDAYGVDIGEPWDRASTEPYVQRLRSVDMANYRLPFPDRHFDFCFSEQVFEHVFNHEATFAEIARVLKPGAISVHRFPGPGRLIENHVMLPSPFLCGRKTYLALCALLGFRSEPQVGMTWRQTLAHNLEVMRGSNYPTKRKLKALASAAGVKIHFAERQEFMFRRGSRFLASLGPLLQRYMVLSGEAPLTA